MCAIFLVKGLFFPSGPFSLIDVKSFLAACAVFLSFFLSIYLSIYLSFFLSFFHVCACVYMCIYSFTWFSIPDEVMYKSACDQHHQVMFVSVYDAHACACNSCTFNRIQHASGVFAWTRPCAYVCMCEYACTCSMWCVYACVCIIHIMCITVLQSCNVVHLRDSLLFKVP